MGFIPTFDKERLKTKSKLFISWPDIYRCLGINLLLLAEIGIINIRKMPPIINEKAFVILVCDNSITGHNE
ncbi:hypothetical protein MASR1M65_31370 [Saprospiraceae bacterium]